MGRRRSEITKLYEVTLADLDKEKQIIASILEQKKELHSLLKTSLTYDEKEFASELD